MNTKFHNLSKNKGSTLLEILVAMTIFSLVMTLAVAAFLNIMRTKSFTSTMKNTQYKVRIATEIVNRLSREANRVKASRVEGGHFMELFYENPSTTELSALRFEITADGYLMLYECANTTSLNICDGNNWINPINIIGEDYVVSLDESYFIMRGGIDSVVEFGVSVASRNSEDVSDYYSDKISVTTSSVLENLK